MQDDARIALMAVVNSELEKLRRLSTGADLLGEGERKCLETYARIVKLLGVEQSAEEKEPWTAERLDEVLGGGGKGLPVVREGP